MKRLLMALALLSAGCAAAPEKGASQLINANAPRPFDASADARHAIDAAFASARASDRNVLVVFGGNWCGDSRDIAEKLETEPLRSEIRGGFESVFVDVGRLERNLDLAAALGGGPVTGTPTILILSPEKELLNGNAVSDWRSSRTRTLDEAIAYFRRYQPATNSLH